MTTKLPLMESAVKALIDYFTANMSAKLTAITTDKGDALSLGTVKVYYDAEQGDVPEYPAIFVLGETTDIPEEGTGWVRGQNHISVVALLTDQDASKLKKKCYRYSRAITELVKEAWEGRASNGFLYVTAIEGLAYSPIMTQKGQGAISDVTVRVMLEKVEEAAYP